MLEAIALAHADFGFSIFDFGFNEALPGAIALFRLACRVLTLVRQDSILVVRRIINDTIAIVSHDRTGVILCQGPIALPFVIGHLAFLLSRSCLLIPHSEFRLPHSAQRIERPQQLPSFGRLVALLPRERRAVIERRAVGPSGVLGRFSGLVLGQQFLEPAD